MGAMEMPQGELELRILAAIKKDDVSEFEQYVPSKMSVNDKIKWEPGCERCLLTVAVKENSTSIFRFLLDNNADVNLDLSHKDLLFRVGGNLPLINSARDLRLEMCQLLLDHGARTYIKDWFAFTTVFHAVAANLFSNFANSKNWPHNDEVQKASSICKLIIDHQKKLNQMCMSMLLCFRRLKKQGCPVGTLLYTHRNQLLVPYIKEKYYSIKKLLNARRSTDGKRAFDLLPIPELNPDLVFIENDNLDADQDGVLPSIILCLIQ